MNRILFLCFVLSGCSFPKTVPSYYAKEVCSCLFVEKRGDKSCDQFGQQIIPNWKTSVNKASLTVKAWGLGFFSEAQWLSPQEGCRIIR